MFDCLIESVAKSMIKFKVYPFPVRGTEVQLPLNFMVILFLGMIDLGIN